MTNAPYILLRLCEAISRHQNVTHWAISMRIFRRGDLFHQLSVSGRDVRTLTLTRCLQAFSDMWPADLEWPADIPRPTPTLKEDAA